LTLHSHTAVRSLFTCIEAPASQISDASRRTKVSTLEYDLADTRKYATNLVEEARDRYAPGDLLAELVAARAALDRAQAIFDDFVGPL
jgi:hypothetical protein